MHPPSALTSFARIPHRPSRSLIARSSAAACSSVVCGLYPSVVLGSWGGGWGEVREPDAVDDGPASGGGELDAEPDAEADAVREVDPDAVRAAPKVG